MLISKQTFFSRIYSNLIKLQKYLFMEMPMIILMIIQKNLLILMIQTMNKKTTTISKASNNLLMINHNFTNLAHNKTLNKIDFLNLRFLTNSLINLLIIIIISWKSKLLKK